MSREMDVVTLTGEEYDELMDARDDAARYRWLRDRWFMPFSALPWCGPDGYTGDLDAAIDAAMKD